MGSSTLTHMRARIGMFGLSGVTIWKRSFIKRMKLVEGDGLPCGADVPGWEIVANTTAR